MGSFPAANRVGREVPILRLSGAVHFFSLYTFMTRAGGALPLRLFHVSFIACHQTLALYIYVCNDLSPSPRVPFYVGSQGNHFSTSLAFSFMNLRFATKSSRLS